jgi:hypothetical protein
MMWIGLNTLTKGSLNPIPIIVELTKFQKNRLEKQHSAAIV